MVASTFKCRLVLYLIRLPFLMSNAALLHSWHLPPAQYGVILATIICGCVNDFYMLTWDIYTYGSFVTHAIPQILISSALVSVLTVEIVFLHRTWQLFVAHDKALQPQFLSGTPGLVRVISPLAVSLLILAATAILWIKSRKWLWDVGNKDTGIILVFGRRRSAKYDARKFPKTIWRLGKRLPFWLKNIIYRRIEHVESTKYALTRNVAAVILLTFLVQHSVALVFDVIFEDFEAREVWRNPTWPSPHWCSFGIIRDIDVNHTWSLFSKISRSAPNVITSDILSTPAKCMEFGGVNICSLTGTCDQVDTADIAVTLNVPGNSSTPGRIWLNLLSSNPEPVRLYDHGIQLMSGYQLLGLVELTERRIMLKCFSGMWGFKPDYDIYHVPSIDWIQRTPLNNASIARITLQFKIPEGLDENLVRVTEDYRQHTFLSALSSIGGLLSVLQGLHILFFGRPLFWGMFGSKLLDPFGLFIWGSRALRERMAARYGFDFKSGAFSAEGLSLFLRDFVLDIGPLGKGDDVEDDADTETGSGQTHAYDVIRNVTRLDIEDTVLIS